MSSRLLQMKFMQRAAAANAPSQQSQPASPQTPSSSTGAATPPSSRSWHSEGRPSKKARLSSDSAAAVSSGSFAALDNGEGVDGVLGEEEQRRKEEALERAGRDRGETRWVLSAPGPLASGARSMDRGAATGPSVRFVEVGRDAIDQLVAEQEGASAARGNAGVGRMSFGRKVAGENDGTATDKGRAGEDSGDEDSDDEDEYEPQDVDGLVNGAAEKARQDLKRKRSAERARAADLARDRRRRDVRLNSPRSISSGGGGSTPRSISSGGGNTPRGGGGKRSSLGREVHRR